LIKSWNTRTQQRQRVAAQAHKRSTDGQPYRIVDLEKFAAVPGGTPSPDCDNLAVMMEARYFHISDAGMTNPNFGMNGVTGLIGLTWFF